MSEEKEDIVSQLRLATSGDWFNTRALLNDAIAEIEHLRKTTISSTVISDFVSSAILRETQIWRFRSVIGMLVGAGCPAYSGDRGSANPSVNYCAMKEAHDALATTNSDAQLFQQRVNVWMIACFGNDIAHDQVERGDRLLEEVFELLQSVGYDQNRISRLQDYVWNRPVGEPPQEVGGTMVTLAAFCQAFGLNMHTEGETELSRIWTKIEQIRAKQASKPAGSPLPIATDRAVKND